MQKFRWQAIFLIAGIAWAWHAQAQTIYRCGNAYSQVPCPGAVPMDLNDSRQPEQKIQTEAAALNDARLAKAMEQDRLAEEQRLLAGNRPITSRDSAKPRPKATGSTSLTPKRVQPRHKKPEAFIAEIPDSEKQAGLKKKLKKKANKPK